jgi:hypothetical protein
VVFVGRGRKTLGLTYFDWAVSQLQGLCFAVIELRHEFPVRVAGGVEVVVARGKLNRDVGELLSPTRRNPTRPPGRSHGAPVDAN